MKWPLVFILCFGLFVVSGSAENGPSVMTGAFYSPRIMRELNFYIARHPLYPTNHFCVVATELNGTNMVRGLVYWEEDQMLLDYSELETNATDDLSAWPNRRWKLGRDTVSTEDEINGSDYLITTQQWHDWVNQCRSKGKSYIVSTAAAQRMFPKAEQSGN